MTGRALWEAVVARYIQVGIVTVMTGGDRAHSANLKGTGKGKVGIVTVMTGG